MTCYMFYNTNIFTIFGNNKGVVSDVIDLT